MTTKVLAPPVAVVRTALRGKDVLFLGYDGKHYFARVTRVRRGVATLAYDVRGKPVTAYVNDAARLFSAD